MGPQAAGGGQNPFLQILSQMQQGQSGAIGGPKGPAMGAGGMPSAGGQPALQGGMPGGTPTPGGQPMGLPGQQQPGGGTKLLISALQNLHSFANQAVDPQEAQLIRQILVLLSSLIQKDQARQLQGGGAGAAPQGIQPPMGQGAGGGVQSQPAGIMGR